MSRNDALELTRRLYTRLPGHYRAYDADPEQAYALLALMRVVGEQAANLRQDLDALWDNFFIETADDWAVPYIAALVGTRLLARPVGQSNRLDVLNTVTWRRSKGTPAMLQALARAITGWPADLAEFFQALGWAQNLNHLRLDHPLTPDVRDPYRLSLLGRAADPFAHAADFKPARPLDPRRLPPLPGGEGPAGRLAPAQPRVMPASLGIGRAAWGTPGRYQIKKVGFFVRRLQTFALRGVTPAAAPPGPPGPPGAACFSFDPLFKETPLFVAATGEPLTRAAFAQDTWATWPDAVAVRGSGVLLGADTAPAPGLAGQQALVSPRSWRIVGAGPSALLTGTETPFTFGALAGSLALDSDAGLRLLDPRTFQLGARHFLLTAVWRTGGVDTELGTVSTLHAALRDGLEYRPGSQAAGRGQLLIRVEVGHAVPAPLSPPAPPPGPPRWPDLPPAPPGRFPGAVLAVRAAATGGLRADGALYVYLPAAFITAGRPLLCFVADDGSTYAAEEMNPNTLARAGEGQVYPARPLTAGTLPAAGFGDLNRRPGGLQLPDVTRFGAPTATVPVLVQVELFTGAYQPLGMLATVDLSPPSAELAAAYELADPWPAFGYAPARNAPDAGPADLLAIHLTALPGGGFVPACELIIMDRAGRSLLVYLPEFDGLAATSGRDSDGLAGIRLFVAGDGSTYIAPVDPLGLNEVLRLKSFGDLRLARAAAGQALPIPGAWPLQQRLPVAVDLCDCRRTALLWPGELGIDPQLGRFALPPGDPSIDQVDLTVDYVEAFSDCVGARTYDRQIDTQRLPTRKVSRSGDAPARPGASAPVYTGLADALLAATGANEVIEILDSATYAAPGEIIFDHLNVGQLTIRASEEQRPCLAFYPDGSPPAPAGLRIAAPLARLELSGLLIGGGPLRIAAAVEEIVLTGCTLDPRLSGGVIDEGPARQAQYLFCRCITGALALGGGVDEVIVADSIVDAPGSLAIGGIGPAGAGSGALAGPPAPSFHLERVTVLGRVRCDVLEASECLLDELVGVEDRQAGCIRFSRYEPGSILPRRYQCVPDLVQIAACAGPAARGARCLAPLFNSRRFGRPDYGQLATASPDELLSASEQGAEVGAFAGALNPIRLGNLDLKLREFLPAGLSPVVIAET